MGFLHARDHQSSCSLALLRTEGSRHLSASGFSRSLKLAIPNYYHQSCGQKLAEVGLRAFGVSKHESLQLLPFAKITLIGTLSIISDFLIIIIISQPLNSSIKLNLSEN